MIMIVSSRTSGAAIQETFKSDYQVQVPLPPSAGAAATRAADDKPGRDQGMTVQWQ